MGKNNFSQDYVERDISWMYFNYRILQEAEKQSIPLLERLSFLGIYSNNLDEFFRVRVALLNRIAEYDDKETRADRQNALQTLKAINKLNTQYANVRPVGGTVDRGIFVAEGIRFANFKGKLLPPCVKTVAMSPIGKALQPTHSSRFIIQIADPLYFAGIQALFYANVYVVCGYLEGRTAPCADHLVVHHVSPP